MLTLPKLFHDKVVESLGGGGLNLGPLASKLKANCSFVSMS